jgi:hypothetical protein
MIMQEKENDVIVKGLGETSEFTIKTSAKAFKILSQNLYSNPVGAVIRELSTNAYDSHVMAGCPERPFKIKIPSILDPEFSIRDYGTGLAHDDVIGLYSTFFESTKTQSNDMVGCLGLGSKSPFAITDSFFVISYFNGVKSVYSVFTDKNFIPSISLFGSEDTEEENGLELQIAIKNNLISSFPYELKKQLHFFKTKPIVEGYNNFSFNNFEIKLSGDGWYYSPGFNSSYVVQGQIAYPLDSNLVRSINILPSKFINCSKLASRGYAFEMPIGSVDIAPSREALSYDENTINAIVKKAQSVINDIETNIIKDINESETRWEAINKKYDLDDGGFLKSNADFSSCKWDVSNQYVRTDIEIKKFWNKTSVSVKNMESKDYIGYYVRVRENARFIRVKSTEHKGHDYKVRQFVLDKHCSAYVLYTDLSIEDIQKKLDNKNLKVIEISSLSYKQNKSTTSIKKEVNECKVLSTYTYKKSACWNDSQTDRATEEDFYVPIVRYDVVFNEKQVGVEYLIKAMEYLKDKNIIPKGSKIYGLNKAQEKTTTLRNLFDYISEYFKNQKRYKLPNHPVADLSPEYVEGLSISKKLKLIKEMRDNNHKFNDYRFSEYVSKFLKKEIVLEDVSEVDPEFDKYLLLTKINSSVIPEVLNMMKFCEENGYNPKI